MNIPVNVNRNEEIKESHRQEFNTNVFPYLLNGENPTVDTSRKELKQEQWQDMINTIKVLQPDFVIEEHPELAEYYENALDSQTCLPSVNQFSTLPIEMTIERIYQ